MNLIQAVIFDLDGVLVDTAKFHYQAWKRLANQLGIAFSEGQNEALKGISRKDSLDHILKLGRVQMAPSEKETWLERKNEWFLEHVLAMDASEMLPGAREFLTALAASSIKVALGSASKNAPLILERLQITGLFDAIIDGNHTTRSKPDPEVFLLGSKAMEVSPSETVVFEDAVAGVQAAKNAGMMVIGVGDAEVLNEADAVIPGFSEFDLSALEAIFSSKTI